MKSPFVFMALALLTALVHDPAKQSSAAQGDASALIARTGVQGGLCLLVGAKDTTLARDLAAKSTLYIQVLQADDTVAAPWGAQFANSADRAKLGIRNADFDPEHYGTHLFNLIVVEDAAALGKAKLADLHRILVPNGHAALKNPPAAFAQEAKALGMDTQVAGEFAAVYRKPLKPAEWKPCDSLQWRAGSGGRGEFSEIVVKDGTLSYADRFECPGDLSLLDGRMLVRDAYNGRLLHSEKLGDRKPNWNPTRVAESLKSIKPPPTASWEERGTAKGFQSFTKPANGKLDLAFFGGHCYKPMQLGKYIVYHHNIWVNLDTNERVYPFFVHPYCAFGQVPGNTMLYNFPGSKPAALSGISALAPADIAFDHQSGGKVLRTLRSAPKGEPTTASDWPMFRANPGRGNSCQASPGDNPTKAWEAKVGLGSEQPYGVLSGERTGLTQPVTAYGLVIVSDIDGGRIVAVDAADGKQKWVFHVGSRVDFSPTLYNGLCLFAAKDGWVYCLDALRGELIWKLLVPSRERYIGGHDKLESLWPTRSDVLIVNGTGYVAAGYGFSVLGGVRAVAFKPETGEPVWAQCYHEELNPGERQGTADIFYWSTVRGKGFLHMGESSIDVATGAKLPGSDSGLLRRLSCDGYLDVGNSLPRTMEDISGMLMSDGRVTGRTLAFSDDLSVAYTVAWGGVSWETHDQRKAPAKLNLTAARDRKAPLWKSPDIELVVDDIVVTPQRIYCVGHYQRIKKDPEIWVLSREDGTVVKTIPVPGYPAFMGMSAAGKRLFVSTRDGKLLCFEAK